jgi:hypothetical protein
MVAAGLCNSFQGYRDTGLFAADMVLLDASFGSIVEAVATAA